MLKPVIAATAVLAIAGSSYVYAQQRFDGDRGERGGPRFEQRHRPSADDMAAFTDARIAALRAGLELTPDQAKNWPAFEQALRDMAQLRLQRMQARQAAEQQSQTQSQTQTPTSPFDRLASRADALSKTSAALKRIAETGAPLYASLDDAQKGRFTMLARILRPHRNMAMMRAMEGGGWREGVRGWMQRRFGENGPAWGGRQEDRGSDRGPDGGRMHRMMRGGDDDSQL
jgi:zinc resistance-associated protein